MGYSSDISIATNQTVAWLQNVTPTSQSLTSLMYNLILEMTRMYDDSGNPITSDSTYTDPSKSYFCYASSTTGNVDQILQIGSNLNFYDYYNPATNAIHANPPAFYNGPGTTNSNSANAPIGINYFRILSYQTPTGAVTGSGSSATFGHLTATSIVLESTCYVNHLASGSPTYPFVGQYIDSTGSKFQGTPVSGEDWRVYLTCENPWITADGATYYAQIAMYVGTPSTIPANCTGTTGAHPFTGNVVKVVLLQGQGQSSSRIKVSEPYAYRVVFAGNSYQGPVVTPSSPGATILNKRGMVVAVWDTTYVESDMKYMGFACIQRPVGSNGWPNDSGTRPVLCVHNTQAGAISTISSNFYYSIVREQYVDIPSIASYVNSNAQATLTLSILAPHPLGSGGGGGPNMNAILPFYDPNIVDYNLTNGTALLPGANICMIGGNLGTGTHYQDLIVSNGTTYFTGSTGFLNCVYVPSTTTQNGGLTEITQNIQSFSSAFNAETNSYFTNNIDIKISGPVNVTIPPATTPVLSQDITFVYRNPGNKGNLVFVGKSSSFNSSSAPIQLDTGSQMSLSAGNYLYSSTALPNYPFSVGYQINTTSAPVSPTTGQAVFFAGGGIDSEPARQTVLFGGTTALGLPLGTQQPYVGSTHTSGNDSITINGITFTFVPANVTPTANQVNIGQGNDVATTVQNLVNTINNYPSPQLYGYTFTADYNSTWYDPNSIIMAPNSPVTTPTTPPVKGHNGARWANSALFGTTGHVLPTPPTAFDINTVATPAPVYFNIICQTNGIQLNPLTISVNTIGTPGPDISMIIMPWIDGNKYNSVKGGTGYFSGSNDLALAAEISDPQQQYGSVIYPFPKSWPAPVTTDWDEYVLEFPFGFCTDKLAFTEEVDMIAVSKGMAYQANQQVPITVYGSTCTYTALAINKVDQPIYPVRFFILTQGGNV